MTKLGAYLKRKAVNKSQVSRRTGISKQRISELSNNEKTMLKADELYLIALAIEVDACELLEYVSGDLKLKKEPK